MAFSEDLDVVVVKAPTFLVKRNLGSLETGKRNPCRNKAKVPIFSMVKRNLDDF